MPKDPVSTSCVAAAQFNTTQWSVVLSARDHEASAAAAEALEELCRTYWYPLYAYLRRRGYGPDDAKDLTQGFFERLLSKDYLKDVDRKKGKFRSFLLATLDHFVANEWRHAHAQKRGGQARFISLDDTAAEQQYLQVRDSTLTPAKFYEQQWATALLAQVLSRLRAEFVGGGKAALFDELKIFLTGERREISYAALAARLESTPAALKMAVSRLRRRYGEMLREEIARTVSRPEEAEDELRALFNMLNS